MNPEIRSKISDLHDLGTQALRSASELVAMQRLSDAEATLRSTVVQFINQLGGLLRSAELNTLRIEASDTRELRLQNPEVAQIVENLPKSDSKRLIVAFLIDKAMSGNTDSFTNEEIGKALRLTTSCVSSGLSSLSKSREFVAEEGRPAPRTVSGWSIKKIKPDANRGPQRWRASRSGNGSEE